MIRPVKSWRSTSGFVRILNTFLLAPPVATIAGFTRTNAPMRDGSANAAAATAAQPKEWPIKTLLAFFWRVPSCSSKSINPMASWPLQPMEYFFNSLGRSVNPNPGISIASTSPFVSADILFCTASHENVFAPKPCRQQSTLSGTVPAWTVLLKCTLSPSTSRKRESGSPKCSGGSMISDSFFSIKRPAVIFLAATNTMAQTSTSKASESAVPTVPDALFPRLLDKKKIVPITADETTETALATNTSSLVSSGWKSRFKCGYLDCLS
mmetsp:Transcript_6771/g.41340  ORF Transcript_6771/g.41340 Transcript_6771/m.41340 type:complete len:267 (-) Transcript_6771:208-1008(-)